MSTVLITGANRGLGLELARQYAADGWRVFASCRLPAAANELNALAQHSRGAVSVHPLDVAQPAQIQALAQALHGQAIDLLINNAGVYGDRGGFGQVNYDVWARTLAINTMAPLRMVEAFVEHVARSQRKLIAHITSRMGSIADNTSGGNYAYRSSKAALNMVNASLARDLAGRGVTSVVLHPGWVATDMGGMNAPIKPPESCRGMREVLARVTSADSGKFFNYDGEELPW